MDNEKSLTLHIGLPKTATTTLQAHVFPQMPGYLGAHQGRVQEQRSELWWNERWDGTHTRRLFEGWWGRRPYWREAADPWVEWLCSLKSGQLLLSEERLTRWPPANGGAPGRPFLDDWQSPRLRPHPVRELIDAVQSAGRGRIKTRVIVTLRNQPEFMASLYAQ